MNKVYIFSFDYFFVKHNDKVFNVNKNAHLELSNLLEEDVIQISCPNYPEQVITINPLKVKTNNYVRANFLNDNLYLEIISTGFSNLIQKLTVVGTEIYIYENSVRLIFENICYTYSFFNALEPHAIKISNKIYLINNKNLLIFDCKNKTFNKLNIEKYSKNNNKIEILCKIPRNFCYFLLFSINLTNNIITLKKYKKGDFSHANKSLPYAIFYLLKNNFEDSKQYLENVNFEKICEYFNDYENIIEINDRFYLCNRKQITPISFKIENNKIVDID